MRKGVSGFLVCLLWLEFNCMVWGMCVVFCFPMFGYIYMKGGEGRVSAGSLPRVGGCTPPFLRWLCEFLFAPCSPAVSFGAFFLCCRVLVVHGCVGHRLGRFRNSVGRVGCEVFGSSWSTECSPLRQAGASENLGPVDHGLLGVRQG
jgi:hypothetical protein